MAVVEGRPLLGDGTDFGVHEQLGEPALQDRWGAVLRPEYARGALRSSAVGRSHDDGGLALWSNGGWPWAVAPGGRLPKDWRDDPRFAEALEA
jgi:hypothetical protein